MINLDVSPQETTGYKAETNRLLKRSHEVKAQLEGIKCTTPMKRNGDIWRLCWRALYMSDHRPILCTCMSTKVSINPDYGISCREKEVMNLSKFLIYSHIFKDWSARVFQISVLTIVENKEKNKLIILNNVCYTFWYLLY